jgi:hypothetical protein
MYLLPSSARLWERTTTDSTLRNTSTPLSTACRLQLLLHTRVAARADIGEGCKACKLPQEIQG